MNSITKIFSLLAACFCAVACSSNDTDKSYQPVSDASDDVTLDSSVDQCSFDSDCVAPAGPCVVCDDAGSASACPAATCVEGTCVVSAGVCNDFDGGGVTASDATIE